ncbi:hypothetical protein H0H92_011886 [Tricholoma furcatifolium]|nr:hypothetical protein H0H92_011886 [Tricholoma furcatifolium]
MISSSSSASSLSSKRIRFAPLPVVPRIDIDIDVDPPPPPSPPPPTTQQLLSHQPTTHAPSWSKPKSLNLLRPFPFHQKPISTPSSDNSLTPTQSNDSSATVNLFRPNSCHDPPPSAPSWGLGLTRWASPGSYTKGAPLSRSQSAQSAHSTTSISSKFKLSTLTSKPRSASPDVPKAKSTHGLPIAASAALTTTRQGTRMLNGRVYGGARKQRDPNANPFANARDEDPEFVEWGYGGMGSVRGAQHAGVTAANVNERTRWERLQGQGDRAFVASAPRGEKKGVGGGVPNTLVDEEDDGSGMGWVKKRKRERAEREARQRAEAEAAAAAANGTTPAAPQDENDTPVETGVTSPTPTITPASASAAVSPTPTITEHNLRTVTLPTHLSRHRRAASRTASAEGGVPTLPTNGSTFTTDPASPSSSSASESEETESDSDAHERDDDDEDDDDEEEDEDEAVQQRRKTALGAGVEKVSRHHAQAQAQAS